MGSIANFDCKPKACIDLLDVEIWTTNKHSYKTIKNRIKKCASDPRNKDLSKVTSYVYAFNDQDEYEKQYGCNHFIIHFFNLGDLSELNTLISSIQHLLNQNKKPMAIQIELALDYFTNNDNGWFDNDGIRATAYLVEYLDLPFGTVNKRMYADGKPLPIPLSREEIEQSIIEGYNFAMNKKRSGKNGAYDNRVDNDYFHAYYKNTDRNKDGEVTLLPIHLHRPRLEVNKIIHCELDQLGKMIRDIGKLLKLTKQKDDALTNIHAQFADSKFMTLKGQRFDPMQHGFTLGSELLVKPHRDNSGNIRNLKNSITKDAEANASIRAAVKNLADKFDPQRMARKSTKSSMRSTILV